jgi:hypothetical protein
MSLHNERYCGCKMPTGHTQVVKAFTDLICCYQHSWNPHMRPQDTYKKEMRIQSIELQNTFFLSLRNWMWPNRFNLLLSNPKQNVQLASAKTTRVLGKKCAVSFCLWINWNPFMCNKFCMKIVKCRMPSSTEKERKPWNIQWWWCSPQRGEN